MKLKTMMRHVELEVQSPTRRFLRPDPAQPGRAWHLQQHVLSWLLRVISVDAHLVDSEVFGLCWQLAVGATNRPENRNENKKDVSVTEML
jgi:hypothetical protein